MAHDDVSVQHDKNHVPDRQKAGHVGNVNGNHAKDHRLCGQSIQTTNPADEQRREKPGIRHA